MLASSSAFAASDTMKFSYKDTDIKKVIEDYSAKSGQKFIIDPAARGMITIINAEPVSIEEAFNQLSTALATNSLGISKRDDVMVVMPARAIQRNLIEVTKDLPALKPERMATWIINLKNVDADEVNKQLRILTSKDGELNPYLETNQIIVSDWTSNLHRIAQIIQNIDIPVDPKRKAMASARPRRPGSK
jgi:general secretion pathway protein D